MPLSLDGTGSITGIGTFNFSDEIIHVGDTNTKIRFPAADTISFETNGAERLRIRSDGKVGIGTDMVGAPASNYGFGFYRATGTGYLYTETGQSGASAGLRAKAGTSDFTIFTTQGEGQLAVYDNTNSAERFLIDSSGHVMIGTTTEGFATYGDKFTIADSGHCGMSIRSGTSHYGTIYFSDGDDGSADEVRGFIDYNHSNNQLQLGTNGATRLRITSGGNVNIGGDFSQSTHMLYLASTGDAGIHIRADSGNGSDENANPHLSMSQDGSVAQQLKLGLVGNSGNEFAQSIANGVFLHANTANAQPLQLAHRDNLVVIITNTEQSHLYSYSGNSTGGMKIANRGNDTAAALLLQGHNNSGGTPGQATNTQLTHKGANATFNIRHLGTDRLVIGSTGVVSGDLNDTSDIALKKDIESISTSCIDNIKQLNPVTFKWKDTSRKDIGFIAQEVEDILPDLVNGEDGEKSINTIGLVSQLTKALQEAITKIETLEARVAALEGS